MSPTPAAKEALVKMAISEVVKMAIGPAKFIPGLADQIGAVIGKYIADHITIGGIPDELSRQSRALAELDLPDNLAPRVLPLKKRLDPPIFMNLMMIIGRLRDNAVLLESELKLVGA